MNVREPFSPYKTSHDEMWEAMPLYGPPPAVYKWLYNCEVLYWLELFHRGAVLFAIFRLEDGNASRREGPPLCCHFELRNCVFCLLCTDAA